MPSPGTSTDSKLQLLLTMNTQRLVIASLAAAALVPVRAASEVVLAKIHLDGDGAAIEGEAVRPGREGWIECHSLGYEMQTGEVCVVKPIDRSAPLLLEALAHGRRLPRVEVEFYDGDPEADPTPQFHFVMHDVGLVGAKLAMPVAEGAEPGGASQTVRFAPSAFEFHYVSARPAGEGGGDRRSARVGDPYGGTSDPLRDDDGDGVPNSLDDDDDNDGLPDPYEREHGMLPFVDDAATDRDGDGSTALDEFIGGSDPGDPFSRFRIHRILQRVGEDRAEIAFPTLPGRVYILSTSTGGGRWQEVDRFVTPDDDPHRETVLEIPLDVRGRLFKVEARLP